jgi:hypothetical protein
LWNRGGIVALEEQQNTEVAASVDVIRIERNYGTKLGYRQFWLILFQEFLRSIAVKLHLVLAVGERLGDAVK